MFSHLPDLPTLIFPRTAIRTRGMFVFTSVFVFMILDVHRGAEPLKINENTRKLYSTAQLLRFGIAGGVA
jgi:hypothetical protein